MTYTYHVFFGGIGWNYSVIGRDAEGVKRYIHQSSKAYRSQRSATSAARRAVKRKAMA